MHNVIVLTKGKSQTGDFRNPQGVGQVSWETIPGKTSGVLPGMVDAPYQDRAWLHGKLKEALYPQGRDLLAEHLGLNHVGNLDAVGAYEGETNPGTQTSIKVPTVNGATMSEEDKKKFNAYAASLGYLLKQDAMAWHVPYHTDDPVKQSGVEVNLGRPLSEQETKDIYGNISKMSGHEDYAPVASPNGVRFLNHEYLGTPNPDFHKMVEHATDATFGDSDETPTLQPFGFHGNYIANDWKENKNGEEYLGHIHSDRPDVLRGIIRQLDRKASEQRYLGQNQKEWYPKVSFKDGARTPDDARQDIALDHYSKERRSVIDPEKMGSAHAGEEKKRGDIIPRSYYYVSGTLPEQRLFGVTSDANGHVKHTVKVPASLYDYASDPEGIYHELKDSGLSGTELTNAYERAIAAKGYDGYSHRNRPDVVAMFRPVRVNEDGTGTMLGSDGKELPIEKKSSGDTKEKKKPVKKSVIVFKGYSPYAPLGVNNQHNKYLNEYLKTDFDPYDYSHHVSDYLHDEDYQAGDRHDEADKAEEDPTTWLEENQHEHPEFKQWLEDKGHRYEGEYHSPAYETLLHRQDVKKPKWLVHFTDEPDHIANQGFKYGHPEFEGLHLTTWKPQEKRFSEPGYNFAYDARNREAHKAALEHLYGEHAVVFPSTGVDTYHTGDHENQHVFWGEGVHPKFIHPVYRNRENGKWEVQDPRNEDRVLSSHNTINDAASWISDNHPMLSNLRAKQMGDIRWKTTKSVIVLRNKR